MSRVLMIAALLAPACVMGVRHVGSGELATESRDLDASVTRVHNATVVDMTLIPGEEAGIQLRCDDNLLDEIVTDVVDGELIVRTRPGVNLVPRAECEALVGVPELVGVTLSASAEMWVDGDAPALAEVDNSGAGRLTVDGEAGALAVVDLSGAGAIDIQSATANACLLETDNSGAGRILIEALRACEVSVSNSGAGRTSIVGQVERATVDISGTGGLREPGFVADEAIVRLSGTGGVEMTVLQSVRADLSGTGGAIIHGDPQQRDINESGIGRVRFE